MGILGLAKLIADVSPNAVKETDLKSYFGRKVAIDASMCLYQFLTAVRSEGAQLTSSDGETTSHLMGTFYSNIRLLENGIKPIYVFDGKPPTLKSGELEKRAERREEAKKQLEQAESTGDLEAMDKFNRRLVKVGKQHVQECKELLKLMGIPYLEAPGEAEAQCAALVKAGKVYATATEDMDALTFGSSVLLRHITFSAARKIPIQEFHLDKVLVGLELNQEEFIDLSILLGCDYCDSIRGIGPKRAMELIQKHRNIETILENLDQKKFTVSEDWIFKEARKLFVKPEVADCETLEFKWVEPDEEGLVKYLCGDKQFNEERVRNGVKKLLKSRSNSTQGRLDSFFKVLPATPNSSVKRKAEDKQSASKKKKATPSGKFKGKAK
ncbi:flap endonuclease 1 [Homalodisca vitripennis]|uniref:flap endonuclease 1 n=1 Tax=Homalodisca vitripennis TaxID=197043 RepID=UPI001EEBEF3C|nr:flap endonuclease 1 [Homalodisca vitripennis]KAG8311359.1 Elongation of fatty acids protein 2 [Homalodisca vitripennis]